MIARAQRVREHVANTDCFHYRTHTAAGNNASPRRSWPQQNAAAAKFSDRLVRNRISMQRHFFHRLARGLRSFPDRLRHFIRFAEPDAHLAVMIARDDERAEAEPPAALHDLRATVDEHDLLRRIAACR